MGTTGMWRPHGDNVETMSGQHGDLIEMIQFCLKIYDL